MGKIWMPGGGGADLSVVTAVPSDVLAGRVIVGADGEPLTGTKIDRGAVSYVLPINGTYTIPEGSHNGQGKVTQNITTKAAASYTPGTSDQVIAAGQYLSGAQTLKGDSDLIAANIIKGKSIFNVTGTRNYIDKIGTRYDYSGYELSSSTSTESVISISTPETANYPYILAWWGCGGGAYFPLEEAGYTSDRVYLQFSSSLYYKIYMTRPTLSSIEVHFLKVYGSGYGACVEAGVKICAGSNVSFK